MNILLTDLNSLSPDLPDLPPTAAESSASFTRLFREQLTVLPVEDSQVIDLKSFFSDFDVPPEGSAKVAQALAEASLADFPRQQPQHIPAVATSPGQRFEVAAQVPFEGLSLLIEPAEGVGAVGAALPQGGNPLPAAAIEPGVGEVSMQPAALALEAAAGLPTAALPVQNTLAAKGTAAGTVGDAPGRRAGQLPTATETALSMPAVSLPSAAALRAVPPTPAASAPMAVLDTGAAAAMPEALRASRPPPALERAMASLSPRPLPDAAATAAAARSLGESPAASPPGATGEHRRSGAGIIEIPAAPHGAVAVDSAHPGKSRMPVELVTVASRIAPESGAAAGEAGVRSAEIPAPANGVQVQATAAAQAAMPPSPPGLTAAPPPLASPLETPGLSRGSEAAEWGNAVGERVSWMINHKLNSASIRLDPPVLGKLDVQVRISDDTTTITIQAQHAQTRDLIDAASVRLRDYLQESGFHNVNVDVSQRQDQQQARAQTAAAENGGEQADSASEQDSGTLRNEPAALALGEGLLDTFA